MARLRTNGKSPYDYRLSFSSYSISWPSPAPLSGPSLRAHIGRNRILQMAAVDLVRPGNDEIGPGFDLDDKNDPSKLVH